MVTVVHETRNMVHGYEEHQIDLNGSNSDLDWPVKISLLGIPKAIDSFCIISRDSDGRLSLLTLSHTKYSRAMKPVGIK